MVVNSQAMELALRNGHFGASHFVPAGRRLSFISEAKNVHVVALYSYRDMKSVHCRVVPFSECPGFIRCQLCVLKHTVLCILLTMVNRARYPAQLYILLTDLCLKFVGQQL